MGRCTTVVLAVVFWVAGAIPSLAQPPRIPVSCARGEDLQRYIDSAPPGFEVYIEDGPCNGEFTLRNGVLLVGAPGAGVELVALPGSGTRVAVLLPEETTATVVGVTIRGELIVMPRSSLTLRSVAVTGSTSRIYAFDSELVAEDVTVIDGGGVDLVRSSATFRRSLIKRNFKRWGGGISVTNGTMVLEETQVLENHAEQHGGGIAAGGSDVRIHRSLIAGNQTHNLYTINAHGGGLYVAVSTVQVTSSSIFENAANFGHGGGLYVEDEPEALSVVRLENTTIANNVAGFWRPHSPGLWGRGGGIYVAAGHDVELRYVTLAQNWAHEGGGVWVGGTRATRARASIFSGNVGGFVTGECGGSGGLTGNYLLVVDPMGCLLPPTGTVGNITGISPRLGAAASDGITTFLPLDGKSPALDRIPAKSCLIKVDQRLRLRPQGSGCDLGAVEGK